MSQKELAASCQVSEKIISDVERGQRVNLESELLHNLAHTLGLTPAETEKFHQLAAGVKTASVMQLPMATAIERVRSMALPAILHDNLFFLYQVNAEWLALFDLPPEMRSLNEVDYQANYLLWLYQPEGPFQTVLGSSWSETSQFCLNQFRLTSLPLRHTPAFRKLFQKLIKHSSFWQQWMGSMVAETAQTDDMPISFFTSSGEITFWPLIQEVHTEERTLYICLYVPADRHTLRQI